MDFRTEAQPLNGYEGLVSHRSPMLLIGSCFSDNIGAELTSDLFDVSVNPFGPLYNPLSILHAFRMLEISNSVAADELFEHEGRFHSWNFHSRYSDTDKAVTVSKMNGSLADARATLRRASCVIITLGTTTVYSLRSSGRVVANCHKMPGGNFEKKYMSLPEITKALRQTIDCIRHINPEAAVMFTVSPLRYLSDGMHANTLIKAKLHLAINEVVTECEKCLYFPAYEIMNDDLRDYRFYAADMKHPSEMAVKYIYEIFSRSFFSQHTIEVAAEARKLYRRLNHRTLSSSPLQDIKELEILNRYPELQAGFNRLKNDILH
ncbi:MAG: GSCFA domain-containing protein [Muribaculaceae bacterium]|nr:GSCFA domain-containing protein [Muribaculaceae bacterium]